MDSLVALAEKKQLPAHQYMDKVTLDWIVSNNPFKNLQGEHFNSNPQIINKIDSFRLPDEWLFSSEEINTIHGIRHILRVAINGLNLLKYGFDESNLENTVFMAAMLHDISRTDDHSDEGHAQRSAEWFLKNITLVEKTFFKITNTEKDDIYFAILFHEIPLENLSGKPEYAQHKRAVDLLKIADALDRYRQPKTKWWINDEKIPFSPPLSAKEFAFDLVVKSETNNLMGLDNYTSVLEALKQI